MEANQRATLGCGTLILIALIVMIFGNMAGEQVTEEIEQLCEEVRALQSTVSSQSQAIEELKQMLSQVLEPKAQQSGNE